MIGFGILGYLMCRFYFPVAPLVLVLSLWPLAERHFITTMLSFHNDATVFVTRPISALFLILAVLMVVIPFARKRIESRTYRETVALGED